MVHTASCLLFQIDKLIPRSQLGVLSLPSPIMDASSDDDPGGGSDVPLQSSNSSALPATSDWAGGRRGADEPVKLRSYEETSWV